MFGKKMIVPVQSMRRSTTFIQAVLGVAIAFNPAGNTWGASATWAIAAGGSWTATAPSNWNTTGAYPGVYGANASTSANLDVATFENMPSSAVYYPTTSGNDINLGGIYVNTSVSGSLGFQSGSANTGSRRIFFTAGGRGIEINTNVTGTVTLERAGISSGASGTVSFINNATASSAVLRINSTFASSAPSASELILGGGNTGPNTMDGAISTSGGALSLRKRGASYWVLGAASSYGGGTVIEGGTVGVASNTAFGTGTVTVNGGNFGSVNSQRTVSNSLIVSSDFTLGGLGQSIILSGPVDLGGASRAITFGNSATLSGTVSNGAIVVAQGAGSLKQLTLSGNNTYSDGTTVNSGELVAGVSAGVASFGSGSVTINGGNVNLNGRSDILNTFILAGGTLSGGTVAASQIGGGQGTINAVMAGGSSLTKSSAGVMTITNINTYSGQTLVNQGTLLVNGTISGGGATTVALNAILGGTGSLAGTVTFAQGAKFQFNSLAPLNVTGNVTFGDPGSFGVDDIVGLDATVPEGTYTLLAGTVNTTGLANLGPSSAYSLGSGKSAYLQSGSLQVVVVPEPATLALVCSAGLAVVLFRRRRG